MNNMKSDEIIKIIKDRVACIEPTYLDIKDDSRLHENHNSGAAGHYTITIISKRFINLSIIEQHKLVYKCLRDLIPFPIHALAIKTKI
ncbi:BolA protein [Candidatus Kinetoplastibacterium blastocrithidii TCC012E]|uniref:BolA protein n=1 Tax=Candidatus Kinetoplastidibacterium blastocrithidiae TCC012E TaxID=1208922 RepID=M1M475_9PROT|nr:BolA family protein [Candidatus Kinetoplastibacterium blastocrithidii]AFZ83784.1 BolA protein [Candidatus Kinetoplastibacterium blastocrithidii (ex Strigomonas culicis)]AGF49909.1 BolA protein [Candidatus Kinetoplastibacterium blastocrithidii TCC012E]